MKSVDASWILFLPNMHFTYLTCLLRHSIICHK